MALNAKFCITPLIELGTFKNGVNFTKAQMGQGVKVINVKDIFGDSPWINYEGLDLVDVKIKSNSDTVHKNDLFFVRSSVKRDGIGLVRLAKEGEKNVIHCGFIIRFRLNNRELDPLFLTYQLRSPYLRKKIINLSSGSAIINISQNALSTLSVSSPPLPIQRKIASILSAYDDLIENNLRRIKILEEMAQNLYGEWFVKFRFPGHEKVKFVDSELGRIPEGWGGVKLRDLVKIRKGQNITKKTIVPGSIPVVAGGIKPAYYHNRANTHHPAVTISASGANAGYVCLYHEAIWASDCSVIDRSTTEHVYFFYLQLKERQHEITRLQRGAAQPHVYPKDLMEIDAVGVPTPILNSFHEEVSPVLHMVRNLSLKNQILRQTRDLLLPKLISGELDVSELDIKVPEETEV